MKSKNIGLLVLIIWIVVPVRLISQYVEHKPFGLQLSAFAGIDPIATINWRSNIALGIRAGILDESGLYAGAVWSIHPFVMGNFSNDPTPMGANPQVICGELGWEFQLTSTTFLRPYLSLGLYGINDSYQGYGGLTLLPTRERLVFALGAIYSVQIARYVLIGAEARAIIYAGLQLSANISYRLH